MYATGSYSTAVSVGDFNNDNNISVLLGTGDGIFQDEMNGSIVESPRCLIVSDLNNDVKLDLATTDDLGGNCVKVLLGNGDDNGSVTVIIPKKKPPVKRANNYLN